MDNFSNIKWVWEECIDVFGDYDPREGIAELKQMARERRVVKKRRKIYFYSISSVALFIIFLGLFSSLLFIEKGIERELRHIESLHSKSDFIIEVGDKLFVNECLKSTLNIYDNKVSIEYSNGSTIVPVRNGEIVKIHVPEGMRYKVKLSDGSVILLGPNSSLISPVVFTEGKREISTKGNAHFQIAKDKYPFIVKIMEEVSVIVYGTVFSINSEKNKNEIDAFLYEGVISLKIDQTEHVIGNNQKISYNTNSKSVFIEDFKYSKVYWKDNCIYFNNVTIDQLADEIANWYNISVQFNNYDIGNISFTGNIPDVLEVNEITEILNATKQFKVTLKNGTMFIGKY
jgi:hypothetical protein